MLIRNDANMNILPNKFTPLHVAIIEGKEKWHDVCFRLSILGLSFLWFSHVDKGKLAEGLMQNGANLNSKDFRGSTPLHIAVQKESENMAEILVRNGADINAKDILESTPLHIAIKWGWVDKKIMIFTIACLTSHLFDFRM